MKTQPIDQYAAQLPKATQAAVHDGSKKATTRVPRFSTTTSTIPTAFENSPAR